MVKEQLTLEQKDNKTLTYENATKASILIDKNIQLKRTRT